MPGHDSNGKEGLAVWMNKREVARIDFDVAHTLARNNDGWRAAFGGDGSLRVRMAGGGHETIGVGPGGSLMASGEDFYLQPGTAPAGGPGQGQGQGQVQGQAKGPGKGKA